MNDQILAHDADLDLKPVDPATRARYLAARIREEHRRSFLPDDDPQHVPAYVWRKRMTELWSLADAFEVTDRLLALLDPRGVAAQEQAAQGGGR